MQNQVYVKKGNVYQIFQEIFNR